jgi:hypothetical protein
MNIEKFSDRAKGFLQSAQTVAIRNNHQRVAPEHVLKALLEDDQGLCSGLIKAAGGVRDLDGLIKVRDLGGIRCGATATAAMLDEFRRREAAEIAGRPVAADNSALGRGGY